MLRVLVAGGGVAALEATLALRELARERVAIELIAPEREFVYRPLAVADPFRVGETRTFPLERLVEDAGAVLRTESVVAVDRERYEVTTRAGTRVGYDSLLVALGGRPTEAIPNALTFSGPQSGQQLAALLEHAVTGAVRRIAFALPAGNAWPLPLYELALLTRNFLVEHNTRGIELLLVTPEDRPLAIFGSDTSEVIAELLASGEIQFRGGATPLHFEDGVLTLAPSDAIEADGVVALARLEGPRLDGLPHDGDGFIPIDEFCRVGGEPDIYAAGDATQFPVKQGGIAAQQADVAAASIASRAGSTTPPTPFRPVLRGLLLTGLSARFLHAEPGTARSRIDTEPLWWPPAKIVGRHLAPFLASRLGLAAPSPQVHAAVQVELELDPHGRRDPAPR